MYYIKLLKLFSIWYYSIIVTKIFYHNISKIDYRQDKNV